MTQQTKIVYRICSNGDNQPVIDPESGYLKDFDTQADAEEALATYKGKKKMHVAEFSVNV